MNVESSAFITADAWFCLIMVVGGLLTGVVGYRLLVRRSGWLAAAGLILGAVAGALVALWVGENIGLGTYNHLLATSPNGTYFHASLALWGQERAGDLGAAHLAGHPDGRVGGPPGRGDGGDRIAQDRMAPTRPACGQADRPGATVRRLGG